MHNVHYTYIHVCIYVCMYNQLYNGILRGFGNCGEVKEGIEFGSEAFWKSISALTVADRVAKSKNMFSSTVHVLASSIKKLQVVPPLPPLTGPLTSLQKTDVASDLLVSTKSNTAYF